MISSTNKEQAGFYEVTGSSEIYAECVRFVYRHRTRNLIPHLLVSGLPLLLGWTDETHAVNLALIAILWTYAIVGIYFGHKFNSSAIPDEETPRWGRALYYQLAPLGLLYNLIFMHLAFYGVENAMFYLLMVSAFFSAGVIASYQHLKWLGALFLVSVMGPQFIYYLMVDGMVGGPYASFLISVFVIFMINIGAELYSGALKALLLTHELKAAKEEAEHMAHTDALTGLKNRRAFYEMGQTLLANALRYDKPFSIIMLDIDFFKRINDTYGHAKGDKAIRATADRLRKVIRESDVVGRVGGEEFAVILPETNAEEAYNLAERTRTEIGRITIAEEEEMISFTVSVGVAQCNQESVRMDMLMAKADQALYTAKAEGRNKTIIHTNEDISESYERDTQSQSK